MATPAGQFRPVRLIMSFIVITAALYSLVFFTNGSNTPKLGIDLQGGTRITMTASTLDGSDPTRQAMQQARTIMESRINGTGVAGGQVQIDGSNVLVVTVPGNQDLTNLARSAQMNLRPQIAQGINSDFTQAVEPTGSGTVEPTGSGSETAGATGSGTAETTGSATAGATTPAPATVGEATSGAAAPSSQGLRGAGQLLATTEATASDTASSEVASTEAPASEAPGSDTASSDAASTDAASTDAPGTEGSAVVGTTLTAGTDATAPAAEPTWPDGSNPDNPSQPASSDPAAVTAWLTSAQSLVSAGGISCTALVEYNGLDKADLPLLSCDQQGIYVYLLDATIIPGDQIDNATSGLGSSGGGWTVNVEFDSTGFGTWSAYTAQHVGEVVAFTLDGQVLSAPSINGPITTVGTEITGSFNQESASALANALKFGALPLAFEAGSSDSVSAELGLEYLTAGLIAGGIGLLLVVLYCLIYYRLLGVITILSLLLSFGLVYAVLVLLGRWIGLALDMSGVAGLIIAIGITADSFVVYFERLKDEVREGRTFRSAVPRGWQQAKRTILSADAVSFLAAAILYVLAVGEVKGFAFTLGLSTVLDLVVVFLVTHPLVALASGNKIFASTRWSGLGAVAAAGAERRASQAQLVSKEA